MTTEDTNQPAYPTEDEIRQAAWKFVETATEALHDLTSAQELIKEIWKQHHGL